MNLLYIFQDPFGADACKIGITGNAKFRLGNYQQSYYVVSRRHRFDMAYWGGKNAVGNLEKAIKREYDWSIDMGGQGMTEWIGNQTVNDIVNKIDRLIEGYKFKVYKVPKDLLPITVENIDSVKSFCQ